MLQCPITRQHARGLADCSHYCDGISLGITSVIKSYGAGTGFAVSFRNTNTVMVLSSDELEILGYLKSWKGKYVTLVEISRSAGGRQRFKETPKWANPLMARLVEMNLAEVNERGHYRAVFEEEANASVVGDDYFPAPKEPEPVESVAPKPTISKQQRWIAPEYATILNKSGKKFVR